MNNVFLYNVDQKMRSFVQILIKKRCSFHREQFFFISHLIHIPRNIVCICLIFLSSGSIAIDCFHGISSSIPISEVFNSILLFVFPHQFDYIQYTPTIHVKSKTLIISIQITIINEELKEKLTHIEQQTLSHALIIHSHLPSTIKKSNSYKNTKATTTTIIYVSNELIVS